MSDPHVDKWKPRGTVSMWLNRLLQKFDGWNITADDVACDALLELFDRMENAKWPAKKRMPLVKLRVTADHGGRHRFRSATHLTIKYPKDRVADEQWTLEERDRELFLSVGLSRLRELRDAIVDMKQGGGDYCIGGDEHPLWIWWFVERSSNLG